MGMNRNEIERLIPHRPPFLWIDEVVDNSPTTVHARKFLDPALEVFTGHYPGFAVLPGVLLCEAALQTGALLIATLESGARGRVPVVGRLNNVKFRRMVRPGETLDIYVELTEKVAGAWFLRGRTEVGGQTACSLEFACTLAATQADAD
jgi:3-hydroxyacyl-[acyl-carrier-protein] dehydratase